MNLPELARLAEPGRHFTTTDDISDTELELLLELADRLKQRPLQPLLAGKVLGMVFFNPSLRTRASFEAGMFQLGGHAIHLGVGQGVWQLEHRDGVVMNGGASEHLREAVPVLARYCDMLAVRCFPSGSQWSEERTDPVLSGFTRHSTVPVINLESSLYHPCQALADLMTMREKFPRLSGKRFSLVWCNHPKALPTAVPNSAALIASRAGMQLSITHPPGYELDSAVIDQVRANCARSGGSLTISNSFADAFQDTHVVYAKSWGSLGAFGDNAKEMEMREPFRDWMVTERRMATTANGIFMHCLPVRRNVVVADEVLDGPRSVVIDQAENRLHAQKALLVALAGAAGRCA
jgi:N-acetylornithine carbamoyltransferase